MTQSVPSSPLRRARGCTMASHLICERGAALIVCLLMLVVILMLGTSASHIALQEEKASQVERDRQLALESAEAALTDAERDIETSSRKHLFSTGGTDNFSEECGDGGGDQFRGLCLPAAAGGAPLWQRVDLASKDMYAATVPYGYFTGRILQTGDGILPAALPRYLIELIPFKARETKASGEEKIYLYRITAIGFGVRETTAVVLQTFYRKTDAARANVGAPAGRLSWREIPNWQELHDAYAKG